MRKVLALGQKEQVSAALSDVGSGPRAPNSPRPAQRTGFWTPARRQAGALTWLGTTRKAAHQGGA
jgi:hypothetical protein